ncbi:MAG: T9SS type A sorting domain-containing protein [Candidatus Poribacteria bacterium]|nr:T9SS type A sorting domain-containing protein [Candidatus Poribacteria bacterium]
MKITRFSILTLIFMVFALVPNSFGQAYTQWDLPEGAKARFGKGNIEALTYSPDGRRLAVAGSAGIWIYDTQTGIEIDRLTTDTSDLDWIKSVAYSPDGGTLASSTSHKVYLWDTGTGLAKGEVVGPLIRGVDPEVSVRYSPDGGILASAGYGNYTVRLWNTVTGEHLEPLRGHTEVINSIAFSPDGRMLASGSSDKTVRLWDVESGTHKATLAGHTEAIYSVSFSPDGTILASGGRDGKIRLWNVVTGELKATLGRTWFWGNLSFSPDGTTLANGSIDGNIRLWDVVTSELKATLKGHSSGIGVIVTFSPDGTTLTSGSWDGKIRLWNATTGQLKATLGGHTNQVTKVVYSPDGSTLAIGHWGPNDIELWDVATGQRKAALATHSNAGDTLAYSPDGRTLAIGNDTTVELWDTFTGQKKAGLAGHKKEVWSIAYSPDGGMLASGGVDGTVRLWDAKSGAHKHTLIEQAGWVSSVGFSPDSRMLASADYTDDTVRLWDVDTGRLLKTFMGHLDGVSGITFSPDGKTLAVEDPRKRLFDSKIVLWDVASEQRKATIPLTNGCYYSGVAFSPDGSILASGNHAELLLWDIAIGEQRQVLYGHAYPISSLAFGPNGSTLASGSGDGTVLLWDVTPFVPEYDQLDTDIRQTQPDTVIQQYEREQVRLIYFRPSDRPSRQGIDTELDTLIRWSQYFFAEQMQDYGRKTFAFETDATGHAKVHHVTGKFTDTYYHGDTYDKVVKEVAERFDTSRDVFLIAVDVSSEFINNEGTCGIGGGGWKSYDSERWRRDFGGTAVIPASGVCINPSITAHELGHVFGLEHDFRDDAYLMAYGTQERLSHCAAEWLDAHRFFNNDPTTVNETTTIAMHPAQVSNPGTRRLQFELTDTDGLHQAQLIVPAAATDPAQGTKLHSCKSLNDKNQTVAFLTTDATVPADSEVTLQVIDGTGNITRQAFSLKGGGITSKGEDITSNRAPVAVGTIPEQNLTVGGNAVTLSISPYFSDPDGDVLSYKAQSNNTRVVGVRLFGTQITIGPRTVGSTSVAVTASDGKSLVTQRISVHVRDALVNAGTDGFDDAFEGTALQNPNWKWQNEPANWDVGKTRDGFLHIESETNRNLWASDASHFLYQETDADAFDVETHFFSRWDTASGVNGLVVKSPADNNWVTIKFWSRDAGAKGQIQYQTRGRGLVADPAWRPEFGATELFLRLRKQGDTYTGWYKTRAADPWIEIGVANFPLTPPLQLGIYAGVAAGTGTLTVDYDYFRSTVDTGVLASPMLQIAAMETPTETTLLPNYPNPFNPETWIPYRLSSSSDVTVRIYAINGNLVRRLALGHQAIGVYQSRSRAAYWDGKNEVGEPVASGVYFYTLTAGEFAATRKMLIRK